MTRPKALITAAGKGTRHYPATNAVQKEMFPLVDRDGISKPTLQIIVEEVLAAGIEEIAVIVQPGEEEQFRRHFTPLRENERPAFRDKPWAEQQSAKLAQIGARLTFLYQTEQKGFGHAVYCGREWAGDAPILLLLGDHVYLSRTDRSCVKQVLEVFGRTGKSVFGLQRTPAEEIHLFGVAAGNPCGEGLYELHTILEKPSIEEARRQLRVETLPPDQFLAIFGIYVLTPTIFDILDEHIRTDRRERGEIQLTSALAELIAREGALGYEVQGERLDMGTPLGWLQTQIALAAAGVYAQPLKHYLRTRFLL
ncbi:MAG: sugar phosphate nucleotidyltransferase [candidate division KSB1 bacterium]|nr:sugar phosphate nucleotidyltransferase [candidate division KSB1 bacterium]